MVAKNRVLWRRMAEARAAAGRSAKEVFDACGRYWSESNEKGFLKHEAGEEKLTASDQTPYSYMFSASDAVQRRHVAKAWRPEGLGFPVSSHSGHSFTVNGG